MGIDLSGKTQNEKGSAMSLSQLYETLSTFPVRSEFSAEFRYWHIEALLGFGAQLLQRASDERDEYYQIMLQSAGASDLMAREENEYASTAEKIASGVKYGEEERARSEYNMREGLKSTIKAIWDAALTNVEKTKASVDMKFNEDICAGVLKLANSYERERKYLQETYLPSERKRLKDKSDSIADLEFAYRLDTLSDRIMTGYRQALDCLAQASVGLETILGYSESLPDFIAARRRETPSEPHGICSNALDTLIEWTRDANFWLSKFSENDQQFTKSIFLKETLGDAFKQAVGKPKDDGSVSFAVEVKPETFSHQFVRLRGLSLYLYTKSSSYEPWEASVSAPKIAGVRHFAGEDAVRAKQPELPAVEFGRILTRNAPYAADILGGISVGNASPISYDAKNPWKIDLRPMQKSQLENLSDLELELHLTGQPRLGV